VLESFWEFDCKCSREEPRLLMTTFRIVRVKILKNSLGIIGISIGTHGHCIAVAW
jgi:hypothetical protein